MTGRADVHSNWECVVTCQEYILAGLHSSVGGHQLYIVMGIRPYCIDSALQISFPGKLS